MKIPIVNESDEVIAYKEREAIAPEDIYRVSALWVKNSKGESLLAQRAFTKKHSPGKWEPAVAGTIEEGEDYDSNIIKEIEEELGLKDIKILKAEKIRRTGLHNFFVQFYTAIIDKEANEFIIDKNEAEQVKWMSREQILAEAAKNPVGYSENIKEYIELFG